MALEMLQGLMGDDTSLGAFGEDTMEGGLGGGTGITPPSGYQIPVNRQPAQGGLAGAATAGSLASAKQDYLKATQEMIDALQQRISGQGYDISRLLFAFGQPTATGSIGSALANVGAEASRQRGEQEKMMPSMMKMRTELAANRLAMAQQEEAERVAQMLGIGAPGANVQAVPGSGASAEAAMGTGQAAPNTQMRRLMTMDPEQLLAITRSLGPAGEKLYSQVMQAREDYRKGFLSGGQGSFYRPDSGQFIQDPASQMKPNPMTVNIGNFSGEVPFTLGQAMAFQKARETGGDAEAAKYLVQIFPNIAERIGAIAPSRPATIGQPVVPVQAAEAPAVQSQPAPQPAAPAAAQPQRPFETQSEKEQRLKIEAEQAKQDIGMLSDEIKEARSPILTRYDKAPEVLREARQMTDLGSKYPYAIGIFNKPGMGPAIAKLIQEGVRVGPGISIQLGGFEDAVRRVVKADPAMVARVAQEQNMSTDQAQRYLQQQGLDAVSLLLQSERRLDNLLNKAERKGEGSVSNFERVYFAQALPSLSNDPVKAYLLKTLALQEMAKFDQKVGELLMRRSESKQYDPRKMYQSDEYKALRSNYINSLEGITREFFPEFAKKQFKEIRKQTGV